MSDRHITETTNCTSEGTATYARGRITPQPADIEIGRLKLRAGTLEVDWPNEPGRHTRVTLDGKEVPFQTLTIEFDWQKSLMPKVTGTIVPIKLGGGTVTADLLEADESVRADRAEG